MTTQFTSFAFQASGTGVNTAKTLPDRLIDIINVKDFGALGDGVTDDWAAIMAAYNHTGNNERGTVFFPPGTYRVSQPIDFSSALVGVGFLGVMGASTVTGNFADYIFKRDDAILSGFSGFHAIEKLTIINNNAAGGGILMGQCVGAAIRDCNVAANIAINDGNYNGLCSFEVCVENCTMSPGSNVSGSIGLSAYSDGLYVNCYINGFDQGIIAWGGEGGQDIAGCRIENCATGFVPGALPPGATGGTAGGFVMDGCHFKNCGTAININSSGTFRGILIEGTNAQAPGGTNPQYGIFVNAGHGADVYEGVVVNGQFDQYGIFVVGDETTTPAKANLFGVMSTNTGSGSPWGSGSTPVANMSHAAFHKFVGCNVAPVTTTNQLIFTSPITSVTCPVNTVTLTVTFGNLNPLSGQTFTITVSGVPVAGYNGTFQGTVTGTNTLTYTVVGPLANSSGGNIVINIKLVESDVFNVSDADSSSWGGTVLGGGSTHAKVRWNGSNLTVMGT